MLGIYIQNSRKFLYLKSKFFVQNLNAKFMFFRHTTLDMVKIRSHVRDIYTKFKKVSIFKK